MKQEKGYPDGACEVLDRLRKEKCTTVTIYGAQMVAVSVYYALKVLIENCEVKAFLVTSLAGNPAEIDGIPVMEFQEFERTDMKILVAVPENYHEEIAASLRRRNMNDYILIDSGREAALMEQYYRVVSGFPVLRSFPMGNMVDAVDVMEASADAAPDGLGEADTGAGSDSDGSGRFPDSEIKRAVYMTKFYKDRPLKTEYVLPSWVVPIQAGAALTDVRVADIRDDMGDNISRKNENYSELSAAYWIGKHADADYLGLFHYRRILDVNDEDWLRIIENDIDVVLPYPTVSYPNIHTHHKRYLKDKDYQAMLQAMEMCAPSYAAAFPAIFEQRYFYNYNMLIAKKQIFKEYCAWLFPILECTENLSIPKGSERADRYIGYMGENLTTLYFLYHRKAFKIAHAGRRMLI